MWTAVGLFFLLLPATLVVGLFVYIYVSVRFRFMWQLERIFEEKPLFIIPRGEVDPCAEESWVDTANGKMRGVYFKAASQRKGVVVFGIEFGSDVWSCRSYCEPLIAAGYDVFAFEPHNQGKSDAIADYDPLQWITQHEIDDALAALQYVKSRVDSDTPIGWFGISKGANAGLAAMANDKSLKCAVSDGAFGMVSVMVPYMRHWIGIYNSDYMTHGLLPGWFYAEIAKAGIRRVGRRRKVRFYHLERDMPKVDRPILMIHGEADSYIKQEMARTLFRRATGVKDFWVVPKARHNQAISVAGDEYAKRVIGFFDAHLANAK
jgi:uncharacterized protein